MNDRIIGQKIRSRRYSASETRLCNAHLFKVLMFASTLVQVVELPLRAKLSWK